MMGAEAHRAASMQLDQARRYRANVASILKNIEALPGTLTAVSQSIPIARAVDRLRSDLNSGDIGKFVKGLWRHVRDGELHVNEAGGAMRRYSVIEGHEILSPAKGQSVADRLRAAYAALRGLDIGPDTKAYVEGLDAAEARRAANIITGSIKAVKEAFAEIEDLRKFTSAQTVATLRAWGAEPRCPYPVHVWKSHLVFLIGKPPRGERIMLDDNFDEPLGRFKHFDEAA
jgi:hypothetical protein